MQLSSRYGSLSRFCCFFLSTLFLLLSLHVAHAQDDTSNITINITKPQPMPASVPVKNATYVWLSAALDSAPKSSDECTSGSPRGWQGTTYQWSGGTFVDSNGNPTTPTGADAILMVPVATTGNQNITVNVSSTTNSSCGTRRGSGSKPISVLVVGVNNLQIAQQGGAFSSVGGQLQYVPSEKTRLFKAIPDPNGPFPAGKPVWGGTAGASGAGTDTATVTFYGVSSSMNSPQTVTAECGNTVTASIIVFTNTLQHSSSWTSGNPYPSQVQAKQGWQNPAPYGGPTSVSARDQNTGTINPYILYFAEDQANLSPQGIGTALGSNSFNLYNQYKATYNTVDFNGTQRSYTYTDPNNPNMDSSGLGTDPLFPSTNVSVLNNGDTILFNDSPGPAESTLRNILQSDSALTKVIWTQSFKARLTYHGGTMGPLLTWSYTFAVTMDNNGNLSYGSS